jgi:hypothetical protein
LTAFNFDPETLRGLESATFEIESPGPQTHGLAAFLVQQTVNCFAPLTSQAGCLKLYARKKKLA